MADLFEDPRWDTFGLLKESFLAVQAAMATDLAPYKDSIRPEVRDLLIRLARSDGQRLRPSKLGQDLAITPSSMTRLLDLAEEAGVVERLADPSDRRASLVALTEAGSEATQSWAKASLESSVAHTRAHLSDAKIDALESALRILRDEAHEYLKQPSGRVSDRD